MRKKARCQFGFIGLLVFVLLPALSETTSAAAPALDLVMARGADRTGVLLATATPTGSAIREVVLAKQLDEDQRPVEPTNVFAPTDVFYCSVYIVDIPANTDVTAKWFHEDQSIDSYTLNSGGGGSGYLGFNLTSSHGVWPLGNYRVEIYQDDVLAKSVGFTVAPEEGFVARVHSVTMTRAVDLQYKPIAPTLLFGPNETLHCVVLADVTIGTTIVVKWYAQGKLLADKVTTVTLTENKQNVYVDFYLKPSEPFAPGPYSVEVLLNGTLVRRLNFVVRQGVTPPPPPTTGVRSTPEIEVTEEATPTEESTLPTQQTPTVEILEPTISGPQVGPLSFSNDPNGPPGLVFPPGTMTIYVTFDYRNMPAEAEYTMTLYLGDKRVMSQTNLWDLGPNGEGASVRLMSGAGFKPGMYRVVLSVNGQDLQSGEFEIAAEIVVTPTPEPTPTRPKPSPTPRPKVTRAAYQIAYTRTDGDLHSIWVMNLDGSGNAKLADYASEPSWSPDGRYIVFFGWDGSPRGSRGVYQMKADGSGQELVWNEGTASFLNWSPKGRYIAMTALNGVVVYDGKEGKWQNISKGSQPSFSNDGNSIVARSCDGGNCGLFVMGRDGSNRHRITTSADDAMPAWSPVGNKIAFASQQNGNWDIYIVNADGTGRTRLTTDPGIDASPAWLPDGSGIVFRSSRGGQWGIWIMNADGSNQRKIINAPAGSDWGRDRLAVH